MSVGANHLPSVAVEVGGLSLASFLSPAVILLLFLLLAYIDLHRLSQLRLQLPE